MENEIMSKVIVNHSGMNVNDIQAKFQRFKNRIERLVKENNSGKVEFFFSNDLFTAVIYGDVKLTLTQRPNSDKICGMFNKGKLDKHCFYVDF